MAKVTVKLSGFKELEKKVKGLTNDISKRADFEIGDSVMEMEELAVRDAPVDQKILRGGITHKREAFMKWSLISQAFYSPFIEFGTKGNYRPIPGTEDIAASFKGLKGEGGIDQFLLSLIDWVNRKNLAGTYSVKTKKRTGSKSQRLAENYDVAFRIMLSILKKGIKPHPFFFKQLNIVQPKLVGRIEKVLKSI